LQNLKEERDAAVRQTRQLQQEVVTVLRFSNIALLSQDFG